MKQGLIDGEIRCYGNILNEKTNMDCTGNFHSGISFLNNNFLMSYNNSDYTVNLNVIDNTDNYILEISCNIGNLKYELYIEYELFMQESLDRNGSATIQIPIEIPINTIFLLKIQSTREYEEYTTKFKINDLLLR